MLRTSLATFVRSVTRPLGFDVVSTRPPLKFSGNIFDTRSSKRALVSSIFHQVSASDLEWYAHTCRGENWLLAKSLDDLGYQVDLVQRETDLPMEELQAYDVVVGSGVPVNRLVKSPEAVRPTVIAYWTGSHVLWETYQTARRLREASAEKGVVFKSSWRMRDEWTPSIPTFADAIVVTGNDFVARTFEPFTTSPVFPVSLYGPEIFACDPDEKDFAAARRKFLWFGGHSLVHKGLDLVLDYFLEHPEYELHIGGRIEDEPEFAAYYLPRIEAAPNVTYHGFMALNGDRFREVLSETGFVIVPSCSESSCASVLICMINGGLIPVVTPETGVDVGDFGFEIETTTVEAVGASVERAAALSPEEMRKRSQYILDVERTRYTPDRFHERLREALRAILEGPGSGSKGARFSRDGAGLLEGVEGAGVPTP